MSVKSKIEPLRDAVLVEFEPVSEDVSVAVELFENVRRDMNLPEGSVRAYFAMSQPLLTAYIHGVSATPDLRAVTDISRTRAGAFAKGKIEVSRLSAARVFVGATPDGIPSYHYVVRTDVEAGADSELQRWYDEEHMPALAAVPGVVLAQRLVSLDSLPRYYACYDLVEPQVLKTPAWLAVRQTEWSGRVRATFRHTRRIISRRILGVTS